MKSKHIFAMGILGTLFLPIIIVCLIVSVFAMSEVNFVSEDTYESVLKIINEREKQFDTTLLRMPGDGESFIFDNWYTFLDDKDYISHILLKDYEDEDIHKLEEDKGMYSDYLVDVSKLSVKTFLKERAKEEDNDYIPTNVYGTDEKLDYKEKLNFIRRYLLSARENFNLITWKKDIDGEISKISNSDLDYISNVLVLFKNKNSLKIPTWNKYYNKMMFQGQIIEAKEDEDKTNDMLDMYESVTYPYLQHWVEPYAINITSHDNKFAIDVLERMKHPIDVTLYGLDRAVLVDKRYYYLKIKVNKYHVYTTTHKVGTDPKTGKDITEEEYHRDYITSINTSTQYLDRYKDTENYEYDIEYLQENGEYIKVGSPYKVEIAPPSSKIMHKNFSYDAKVTYTESLYEILKYTFEINNIKDEDLEFEKGKWDSSETKLTQDGLETTWRYYDEKVLAKDFEDKTYKVSYLKEEDYDEDGKVKKTGNRITRIEWMFDYGIGNEEMFPSKDDKDYKSDDKYLLDWFNKVYKNDVVYKDDIVLENSKKFNNLEELKEYIKLKYHTNPKENLKYKEYNKYIENYKKPSIQPYSYDDLYIAYDRIDEYLYGDDEDGFEIGGGSLGLGGYTSNVLGWPTDSKVVEILYGKTPAYDKFKFNSGIDISSGGNISEVDGLTIGPSVYAAHDGTIISINNSFKVDKIEENDNQYGNYIEIANHDGTIKTKYSGLSNIAINPDTGEEYKVGDKVKKKDKIANIGKTGNFQNATLHFEVYKNGTIKDPLEFYNTTPEYDKVNKDKITSIPSGFNFESEKIGKGPQAILEAANKILNHTAKYKYSYSLSGAELPHRVEDCTKVRHICCATLVSWALGEAGYGDIKINNINSCSSLVECLDDYTIKIKRYEDMMPGDIAFWKSSGGWQYPHVQIYAGDDMWYNAGNTEDIQGQNGIPKKSNCRGLVAFALRMK